VGRLRSDEILSQQILLAMSLFYILQNMHQRFSADCCVMNAAQMPVLVKP
jgi:hypothetical protein